LPSSFIFLHQGPGLPREAEAVLAEVIDALRARDTEELDEEREAALGVALTLHGFFSAYLDHVDKAQELVQEGLSILRELGTRRELAFAYGIAVAAGTLEKLSDARELLEESLTISRELGYHPAIPWALWLLGRTALEQGVYREAEQHCREALEVSRRNGDRLNAAYALAFLGHCLYVRKKYARARQYYEESLDLFEKIGGQIPIGRLRSHLGDAALAMGDYEEAREHHRYALARYRDIGVYWKEEHLFTGASWGVPVSLQTLGDIALAEGNVREAQQYHRRALEIARDKSYVELRFHVLLGPVKWLARRGNVEGAVELATLALHHPASIEETKSKMRELLAELQRQLEPTVFAAAQERGRLRDLEATVRELLTELSAGIDAEEDKDA
jgi:tetratricopeptide (TPR) repeat protein